MKKILFVFPTSWDEKQLESCRPAWKDHYTVEFTNPTDLECPWDFDVLNFIEEALNKYQGKIDGVTSSSDYPGATVAAAIAARMDLSGSHPETVIGCSHKYYSRIWQRQVVPEATPNFYLVDPRQAEAAATNVEFPCFIKPVKGAFSIMSQRLNSPDELAAFFSRPDVGEFLEKYVHIFSQLMKRLTSFEIGGNYFLAEALLSGLQVTVEGFTRRGSVVILGIVDSVMYPGTNSFARFEYPSSLPENIQRRMEDIARRTITHLDLDNSLFNIEMIYNPEYDSIHIIEINPRLCGQFADLYQKVDGISGYQAALALAAGKKPEIRRGQGEYTVAASFPLRIFQPVRVLQSPEPEVIRSIEEMFPQTLIWNECETGQELTEFAQEDGQSSRYAIINIGVKNKEALISRVEEIQSKLNFQFEPLE